MLTIIRTSNNLAMIRARAYPNITKAIRAKSNTPIDEISLLSVNLIAPSRVKSFLCGIFFLIPEVPMKDFMGAIYYLLSSKKQTTRESAREKPVHTE